MQKLTGQYKNRYCDTIVSPWDNLKRAAFFDVDKTLIKGDSQEQEARFFMKQHRPSLGYLFSMLVTLGALQVNRLGWISLIRQNKIYLRSYRGRTRGELKNLGADLFDRVIRSTFVTGALEILEQHRRDGYLIVLVSATTRHLLLPFDSFLEPDSIFCTDLEFDHEDRCTGKAFNGICGQEKKQAVVQSFARDNHIDLSLSHAYSDHHSDIPFLSSVGRPAVVNPTAKMAAHARKMGWPVHWFD